MNGATQFLPTCDSISYDDRYLRDANGEWILSADGIVIRTPCKNSIPFAQGILGLKVLAGYIPLIFCAYYLINDKKQLLFLSRLLVVIAIICCGLALIQFWLFTSKSKIHTLFYLKTKNFNFIIALNPTLKMICHITFL